ncbi:hypothetical protein HMPREF1536_01281 [Parabacteroides gordonii MS-1 = DSM 23371]|uniref:Uncharacterized protein n=1 Tax=Parabacteroides gordonii MS-1 = DSM 23371 TaxID=1203610 RepID=A0A0F5JLD6_9BACT|nr:hypothetical protein HMPREF1536_01281 [Parabacteroides gordonii MS-1 = DSM 23371]
MMPYINVHAYIIYIMLFYPKICLLNVNEEEQGDDEKKRSFILVYKSTHLFHFRNSFHFFFFIGICFLIN